MKIIIRGKAGQGIQLIAKILARILKDYSYNISLTSKYSPLMRFGESNAYLVFEKTKIENPLIETGEADVEYNVSNEKSFNNMILLGKILKKLDIKFNEKEFKQYLPNKSLKENLIAIKNGCK